jgi:Tfp pilus assembly protein PilN
MIEVNLIPDVKLELLKTRRQQKLVVTGSIMVAAISIGIVVLMSMYAFGVQTVADTLADNGIETEAEKLASIEGLPQSLTLQAQLNKLSELEADKQKTSRLFDILSVVVPEGANSVDINRLSLDTDEEIIEIEAQATNGYEAMEVFKKTLAQTTMRFDVDGDEIDPIYIANNISLGDRNYGEDSQGNRILRFTLSFEYPEELFDSTLSNTRIVGPDQQRVTDSTQGVPDNLFTSNGGSN